MKSHHKFFLSHGSPSCPGRERHSDCGGSCVEELSTAAAVHLPETVVSLLHGALSRCQVPRVVTVPDCKHFGTQVFEKCCSQTQTGTAQCPGNVLAPQAQLRPRAFQGCTALRHLNLGMSGCGPAYPNRCLPDCCFVKKKCGQHACAVCGSPGTSL